MSLPLIRKLPYNHPYRYDGTFFGGPKLWTPSDISTVAWYDAYDESTITESSGSVSQWNDKSGNANHLTQGTGANQPTYGTRQLNDVNVVDFATNQFILGASADFGLLNGANAEFDFYGVYASDSINTSQYIMSFTDGFSSGDWFYWNIKNDSSLLRLFVSDFGGTDSFVQVSYTPDTNAHLISSSSDGTKFKSYYDSKFIGFDDYGSNLVGIDTLCLGRPYTTAPSNDLDGIFAEVIILSTAASEDTRKKIEGYLAHKWGLEDNLIDDHPYKLNPPTIGKGMEQYYIPSYLPTSAWYDASDKDSMTELSNKISQWDDKSGNANHLTQGTASSQPTINSRTLNGLNVVDFDGTDDVIIDSNQSHSETFLIVGVWIIDLTTRPLFSGSGISGGQGWYIQDTGITLQYDSNVTFSGSPYTGARIISVNFDGSTVEGYIDGSSKGSGAYTNKPHSTTIRMMTNFVSSTKGDGAVAEVIWIDNPTNEQRLVAEGYLAHKWGLTASLPSTHPYKDFRPKVRF